QAPPQLFAPLANNLFADATPDQNRQLDQIRSSVTTQSVDLGRINQNGLKGNQLRITLPSAETFDLSKTEAIPRTDQDFTWSGSVAATPGKVVATATFVVHNGDVTGSITSPSGLFRIIPLGNGIHALVTVDAKRLPIEEPPSIRDKQQQGGLAFPQ